MIEQQNSRERERFEADAVAGNLGADAQALIRQRDEAQAVLDNQESTAKQRAEATRQRDEANFRLDRRFEDSDAGRRARERGDQANVVAQQDAQQEDRIARGLELTESPAARAGRELAENLDRVDAGFDELVGAGVLDQQTADAQREEARRRQIDEAFRSQAPAIAGLADSVANALLQGPSRAALNATDVSTVEGARELNRLIRGDDAARDVNLLELQQQTQLLRDLVRSAQEGGADIAN